MFLLRIKVNRNGDIDMKSMMREWQGNYDIDWWPKHHEKDVDIPSEIDKTPCFSLSELQLHKTKSRNKGMSCVFNFTDLL